MLGYNQCEDERKLIYESIATELEHYITKHEIPATVQVILPLDTSNVLLDTATTGEVNQQHHQEMLTTLLGANLSTELPEYLANKVKNKCS